MKRIFLILSVLALSACSTQKPYVASGLVLDDYYYQDCEKLPKLEGTTDIQVLEHEKQIILRYAKCSKMNADKSKVLQSLK